MADQNGNFPPNHPHHPCGPWPSVFPYNKDYPGDHPHRPPQQVPGNLWWNDTEPVMGVYPWESCCDSGAADQCMCITSGEVDTWNQTYSAVSENSAAWSEQAPDNSWRTSADNWQSAYDTVSASSGTWNEAYSIASGWNSASLDSLNTIVSATSAFLSTYSASPYIHVNSAYFDGNGSEPDPLTFSRDLQAFYQDVTKAMNQLYLAGQWGEEAYRNWLEKADLNDLYYHLEKIDKLMWDVKPGITSGTKTPDGIFHQLENIWAVLNAPDGDLYLPGEWISIVDRVISVSGMNPELWYETSDVVSANSGHWSEGYSAYETLSENSGSWNDSREKTEILSESSGNWDSTHDVVLTNSGKWNETYDVLTDTSANWNAGYEAYLTLSSNSGRYDEACAKIDEVSEASGSWNSAYDTVNENSASWSSGSHETWVYEENLDVTNYSAYNAPNTIYFSYYQE